MAPPGPSNRKNSRSASLWLCGGCDATHVRREVLSLLLFIHLQLPPPKKATGWACLPTHPRQDSPFLGSLRRPYRPPWFPTCAASSARSASFPPPFYFFRRIFVCGAWCGGRPVCANAALLCCFYGRLRLGSARSERMRPFLQGYVAAWPGVGFFCLVCCV